MGQGSTAAISRFVHQYKGIEGFYFLNQNGDLGYIKADDLRTVKETFPQINNRHFLKVHPDFMEQLEGFLRDLGDLSKLHSSPSANDFELGYVLPANDSTQKWRSATLVLHKRVVETLRADENLLYKKGIKDPINSTDLDAEKLQGIRSIQRGLDDLTHHRDAFGMYKYFPVLFHLRNDNAPSAKLRVLNLKWRPNRERPDGGANAQTAAHMSSRETVYSVLRHNLIRRGAIDRNRRHQARANTA